MWRIGFSFEKLGLAALRRPVLYSLILLALIFTSAFHVRNLKFDGSILSVLPDRSAAFKDYEQLKDKYRNFSRDVTILVESERLLTASGLEDLRNLHLDVSLADGVAKAVSVFSTPVFDPQTGELVDWFPEEFTSDADMMERMDGLIAKFPQVKSLFSKEQKVAVIVASLDISVQEDDKKSFLAYRSLRKTAEEVTPEDFKFLYRLNPSWRVYLGIAYKRSNQIDHIRFDIWHYDCICYFQKLYGSDFMHNPPGTDGSLGIWLVFIFRNSDQLSDNSSANFGAYSSLCRWCFSIFSMADIKLCRTGFRQ